MASLYSKNKKWNSPQERRDAAAAEIMRLAQGTPIVGYHDSTGQLIIPAEFDDGDEDY